MKTVKKGNQIIRVTNEEADRLVKEEDFNFCPKGDWKKFKSNQ